MAWSLNQHPLEQARQYAYKTVDMLSRDPMLRQTTGAYKGNLIMPYGWGRCSPISLVSRSRRLFLCGLEAIEFQSGSEPGLRDLSRLQ